MSRAILNKFLIFLRSSFAFLWVMLIPLLSPAPEGKLPAAGAHLVSCCMNELCSLLERDREHRNVLPCVKSFPIKLYTHSVSFVKQNFTSCGSRCSLSCRGGKVLCFRERERDSSKPRTRTELQVPSPGHVNKEVKCNVARKRERGSRCLSSQCLQQVMLDGCPVVRCRERESRNEIPRISEHGHRLVQFYTSKREGLTQVLMKYKYSSTSFKISINPNNLPSI